MKHSRLYMKKRSLWAFPTKVNTLSSLSFSYSHNRWC